MESKSYPIEIFQNFVGQGSLEGCPEDFSLMPLGPTLPVMIVRIATTGLTDSLRGLFVWVSVAWPVHTSSWGAERARKSPIFLELSNNRAKS